MLDLNDFKEAGRKLYNKLHLASMPVAIKYIKDVSEIPDKVMRPSAMGEEWSLCQGFTYARRWGLERGHDRRRQLLCPLLGVSWLGGCI